MPAPVFPDTVDLARVIDAWMKKHATTEQRGRYLSGKTNVDTALKDIRDHLFARLNLAQVKKFKPLTKHDVCGVCKSSPKFNVEAITDADLEAPERNNYAVVRKLAPIKSHVSLRLHTGECKTCNNGIEQPTAHVTMTWHGRTLSREYEL